MRFYPRIPKRRMAVYGQWPILNRVLIQLWKSRSIRPKIMHIPSPERRNCGIHGAFFIGDDEEKDNRRGRMVSTLVDRIDMSLLQGLDGLPTTSARTTQVRVPNCDRRKDGFY